MCLLSKMKCLMCKEIIAEGSEWIRPTSDCRSESNILNFRQRNRVKLFIDYLSYVGQACVHPIQIFYLTCMLDKNVYCRSYLRWVYTNNFSHWFTFKKCVSQQPSIVTPFPECVGHYHTLSFHGVADLQRTLIVLVYAALQVLSTNTKINRN